MAGEEMAAVAAIDAATTQSDMAKRDMAKWEWDVEEPA